MLYYDLKDTRYDRVFFNRKNNNYMTKKTHKLTAIIGLAVVFQFSFPQYSHAYGLNYADLARANSILMVQNSPQSILIAKNRDIQSGLLVAPEREPSRKMTVSATAYTSTVEECDSDPFTTANGSQVYDGVIAANFLPFKTKVRIPKLYGNKVFVVEDRMNRRYQQRVDIWMADKHEAIEFGLQTVEIEIF